MQRRLFKSFLAIAVGFTFMMIVKSSAFAIPISPDKYYLDVDFGETTQQELTIYGREQLTDVRNIYIYAAGMRKVGEENLREFYIPDPQDQSEPANWIELGFQEATISAGETVILPWTMTPSNLIGCGTNLAAIIVTTRPQEFNAEGQAVVSFEEEVVSQIHVNTDTNASGQCPENGVNLGLLDFYVDKTIPVFNYDEVPFITRIGNEGNLIARSPEGFIELFGFGEKITIPFNDQELDIYPGSVRKFEDQWYDEEYPHDGSIFSKFIYEITHLRFGKYDARLGVTKNVETQLIDNASFWVIPWKVVIILLAIIATIGILGYKYLKTNKELKTVKKSSKRKK